MTDPRPSPTRGEFVTLYDHFESRITGLEKATCVAQTSLEKRLESMNEFRAAIKDQNMTFVTRVEFEAFHKPVLDDLRVLRESRAELAGKASQGQTNLALIIALIGLILAIVKFFV